MKRLDLPGLFLKTVGLCAVYSYHNKLWFRNHNKKINRLSSRSWQKCTTEIYLPAVNATPKYVSFPFLNVKYLSLNVCCAGRRVGSRGSVETRRFRHSVPNVPPHPNQTTMLLWMSLACIRAFGGSASMAQDSFGWGRENAFACVRLRNVRVWESAVVLEVRAYCWFGERQTDPSQNCLVSSRPLRARLQHAVFARYIIICTLSHVVNGMVSCWCTLDL